MSSLLFFFSKTATSKISALQHRLGCMTLSVVALFVWLLATMPSVARGFVATDAPDIIFVGVGTAGTYVLKELVPAFPNLMFAAVDAGTFLSHRLGATAPAGRMFASQDNLTAVDVPGQYNNLAYTSVIDQLYQNADAPWAFQSKGFGGNANFNGALFQVPDSTTFENWPVGWQGSDLAQYFLKIAAECNITSTPSKDGQHFANASLPLLERVARKLGSNASESPQMPRYGTQFGVPNVAVVNGERCFGTKQLSEIVDETGHSRFSNLRLIPNAKVERLLMNASGTGAVGVEYVDASTGEVVHLMLNNSSSSRGSSRVVLAAGAVFNPPILYRSGVGPQSVHEFVLPHGPNFTVRNEGIGVRLADHVGAAVAIECDDYTAYQSYEYTAHDVQQYVVNRSGPLAQYGPVFYWYNSTSKAEIFVNPWGLGTPAELPPTHQWNNNRTFTVNAVSFDPLPRSYVMLPDHNGSVSYPMVYNNAVDMTTLAVALSEFVGTLINESNGKCRIAFGPGAPPFAWMNPSDVTDVFNYVNSWGPVDEVVWWSHMCMNHFVGSTPLDGGAGFGVDPTDVRVRGTGNVHVVDAGLLPAPVWAHPMATVLAVAAKAADLLKSTIEETLL